MPGDPYAHVEAALQAPPSPGYVPGPKHPPSPTYAPEFVLEPVYLEFMPPEDDVLLAEEQPLLAVDSPTTDSLGYIPEEDLEEDSKRMTRILRRIQLITRLTEIMMMMMMKRRRSPSEMRNMMRSRIRTRIRRRRTQLRPNLSHHHQYTIIQLGYIS
nr:hypothetical protein [Tanacetum cinerariifolium]